MIKIFESNLYCYLAVSDTNIVWFNDLMDCGHVLEQFNNNNHKLRHPYVTSHDEYGNVIRKEFKITSDLDNKTIISMIAYLNDCPKNSFKFIKKFKTLDDFKMYSDKLKVTKELEL